MARHHGIINPRRPSALRILPAFAVALLMPGCMRPQPQPFDVVVYGGTAGGAVAAIAAAQEGASVALLEPRGHIGGMVSGGLGKTDHGNKAVIGGLSREFFVRVGRHYGEPITWYFEPHVAEQVFNDWLKEAGVKVLFNQRLVRMDKAGQRIARIRMAGGGEFTAKAFIDATYEGDLMAMAGVSCTVGREGTDRYGESLAGVQAYSKYHQFDVPVPARDGSGALAPCVNPEQKSNPGDGDTKVQAYNFRVCLCNRKDNQVPFPKPADYDPRRYEILKRYLAVRGPDLKLNDVMIVSLLPNGKTDINNRGPFSTDHIGASWGYPLAGYEERERIWKDHISYVQGFFYFMANDPSVPRHLQEEMSLWGPARDEFTDTDHWPHQLYVREARRMLGEYVMTQRDVQEEQTKTDAIGMGSYTIDSHHVQRVVRPDGTLENEGDFQVPIRPYEIPYRALLPRRSECENLLVPVCMSASHVAYSTLRMEPQYMILGHAAGLAAAEAARRGLAVQAVDVAWLRKRLDEQDQILSLPATEPPHIRGSSLPGVVVDNAQARVTGAWAPSTAVGPFVGADYLHSGGHDQAGKIVRFVPALPGRGAYEIRAAYTVSGNRASNVTVRINTSEGLKTAVLNQKQAPPTPPFVSLGTFPLPAGSEGWVEIDSTGADGYVVADAVQWLPRRGE